MAESLQKNAQKKTFSGKTELSSKFSSYHFFNSD